MPAANGDERDQPEPVRIGAGGPAQELLPMILQIFRDRRQTGATNDALVDHLCSSGSVTDDKIEAAFRAVDRAKFIPDADGGSAYDDSPIRSGNFHMSQPSLYADALAALEIEPGNSFLNVGAGTGYLSSIVCELTGKCMHHGVDLNEDVLEHAQKMLTAQGKDHVNFFHVNVHDVDIELSPRYQRIYLGACAGGESKRILDLLEIGGILVGPFSTSSGQYIRRVRRKSATAFEVKNLKSVQFGTLVPSEPREDKFVLPSPVWTPETHTKYSKAFQKVLMEVLFCTTREESPAHIVPREIFVDHVFGFLHPRWFDEPTEGQRTEVLEDGGERDMGHEGNFDEDLHTMRTLRTLRTFARLRAPGRPGNREERLTLDQFMMQILMRRNEAAEEDEDADMFPDEDMDEDIASNAPRAGQSERQSSDTDSDAPAETDAVADHPSLMPASVAPAGATAAAASTSVAPPSSDAAPPSSDAASLPSPARTGRRALSRGCQVV